MDTIWAAIKTDWHSLATCGGADDYLFFPKDESPARLERVRKLFCDHCPVREKCLNSALINNDTGFWGGTSTDMRTAMRRTRSRAKCPVCSSRSLVEAGETVFGDDGQEIILSSYQVCLACGASWRSEPHVLTVEISPVEAVTS